MGESKVPPPPPGSAVWEQASRPTAGVADRYEVELFVERALSSTLDPVRLQELLNRRAAGGWRLVRHITSTKRVLLFFSRDVHALVFERA